MNTERAMIHPIQELPDDWRPLLDQAISVRRLAYAPYSRFPVGCALVDQTGEVHDGCNVENASYPAGICAERSAVAKMVSRGGRQILRLVLVTSSDDICFPCGVCLQVLHEFGDGAEVLAFDGRIQRFQRRLVSQLFPSAFAQGALQKGLSGVPETQ